MSERYNIKCLVCGKEQDGSIQTYEYENNVEIVLRADDIFITKLADNFFEALIEVRKELEKKEIKLLCKGCCRNVYPSAMLLGMGSGRKAYSLVIGQQAKLSSLVDIFELCPKDEYASIDEQYAFYIKWCDSIVNK